MTSMPGKRASRLAAITSSSGTKVVPSSPIGRKRPQQLLRHLDPGDDLVVLSGSRSRTREAQREVRDVGEGPAAARSPAGSAPGRPARGRAGRAPRARPRSPRRGEMIRMPVLGERRAELAVEAAAEPLAQLERRARWIASISSLGRQPVGAARVDPRLDLVVQAGDPDHEELVEVGLVDRAELDPLQQRHRRVLGELQDALVEVEPGELAVEVERGVLEVDRRRRRRRRRCAGVDRDLRRGRPSIASAILAIAAMLALLGLAEL